MAPPRSPVSSLKSTYFPVPIRTASLDRASILSTSPSLSLNLTPTWLSGLSRKSLANDTALREAELTLGFVVPESMDIDDRRLVLEFIKIHKGLYTTLVDDSNVGGHVAERQTSVTVQLGTTTELGAVDFYLYPFLLASPSSLKKALATTKPKQMAFQKKKGGQYMSSDKKRHSSTSSSSSESGSLTPSPSFTHSFRLRSIFKSKPPHILLAIDPASLYHSSTREIATGVWDEARRTQLAKNKELGMVVICWNSMDGVVKEIVRWSKYSETCGANRSRGSCVIC